MLGHSDEDSVVPVRVEVEGLDGVTIVSAACGAEHSAAVTEDGSLYTWGAGSYIEAGVCVGGGCGLDCMALWRGLCGRWEENATLKRDGGGCSLWVCVGVR